MPPMPRAAALRRTSTGKCLVWSHSTALGAKYSAAKSRAVSRIARSSSVSVNMRVRVLPACAYQPSLVPAPLVHRRNDEVVGVLLDTRRPALRDRLGLGVEAARVGAVLVEVAEAGPLPAAEGVVRDRHRDRHLHPDHAGVDAGGEVAGGVPVPGENRHPVAVFVLARQPQRLLVVVRAYHG